MTHSGETWLVTGATGFLGTNFGASNHTDNLVALARDDSLPKGYSSRVVADLLSESTLMNAVETVKPQYILHTAALASHEECERNPDLAHSINVTATEVLARSAQAMGSKFIYISTDAVFDGTVGNYKETDSPNPFSVYGATKNQGEQAALKFHPESLIVRTNFFGWSPSGQRSILEFFVNNLALGMEVNGYTDFTVTSGYVQDVIRAIHLVKNQSGIWHITSADALTKYQFGCEVAEVFGYNAELINPVFGQGEISRSRDISLNTDKINDFLRQQEVAGLLTQRAGIQCAQHDRLNL